MEQFLAETEYFDISDPIIKIHLEKLDLSALSDKEKAIKLFYHVRDSIKYSVKPVDLKKTTYIASHVLQQAKSFCIPKAIALGTLARAVGIPSRLHFVDFINHRLSANLEQLWGTNVMAGHCYTELYLNGKWVKATVSLDKITCAKHKFRPVEFDGENDALLFDTDQEGRPHAEYIADHGTHSDMSLKLVTNIFESTYGPINKEFIDRNFQSSETTFK
ncbi:MAG: transglutaminase domain-containing protein [Candidatus Heimdallarchaeota archaeon]|nr:transglutaminase domain-containing protein [Candidatus Heimdallarchaeota archaeon]